MNVQLQSNQNSAILGLLNGNKDSRKEIFQYGLETSTTLARDRIVVQPITAKSMDSEMVWNLPRVGILRDAYIYFEITVSNGTGGNANLKKGSLAVNCLGKNGYCELSSRNRTIHRQDMQNLIMNLYGKEDQTAKNLFVACGEEDGANVADSGTKVLKFYMPLLFYNLQNQSDTRQLLILSFLETLSLKVQLCGTSNLHRVGPFTAVVNTAELILDLYNLPDTVYRPLIEANFSSGLLNCLNQGQSYQEAISTVSATNSFTIDLTCNSAVRRSIIQIIEPATVANGGKEEKGIKISEIRFEGSGRELIKCRGDEILFLNYGNTSTYDRQQTNNE